MINISLIILCGLALVTLARRQSAALRHWILAAAIGCAAASPLVARLVPSWSLDVPVLTSVLPTAEPAAAVRAAIVSGSEAPTIVREQAAAAGWTNGAVMEWLWRIWVAGAALSFLVLLVGIGRLVWLSTRAERLRDGPWHVLAGAIARDHGLRREVSILESRHPTLLVTWGVLRPRIMLPAGARDWPEPRIRVVLSHELAHITRGDWVPQLLAEALRSAFWFNPLLWIASRRLRLESERACDDEVLRQGIAGADYAAHLLDLARAARLHRLRPFPGFPAPAMARPCSLERRVSAMLDTQLNRTPATRPARVVTSLALIALTVVVAGLGARAQDFATFSGSVVDPMNAGVPRVTVILTNVQTEAKHEVRSDATGRFEFVGLAPGEYLLEARYPGLTSLKGRLTVTGQDVQKTLAMEIGSLQETIHVAASRGAAPPARRLRDKPPSPPVIKPCTPTASGGNIRPPLKIRDVKPHYPQTAMDAGVGGTVQLQARIGGEGFVTEVSARDTDDPDLAAAAMEAVRQWQFTPTLLNCTPIEVAMTVNVTFTSSDARR